MQKTSIKAIILDDEIHCQNALSKQLEWYCPEVQVVAKYSNPKKLLKELAKLDFDLIFLDINMQDMNGFEFLKACESISFEVIFTTAYDDYAIKAFRVKALDYLLKPIDEEQLRQAVERTHIILNNLKEIPSEIRNVELSNKERIIPFPVIDGVELVRSSEIVRCEADGSYCRIILENRQILLSKTLRDIEALIQCSDFIRVHQSHLVNKRYIKKYSRIDGHFLILMDQFQVPISRSKKEHIKNWILSL